MADERNVSERVPADVAAERAVLGGIITDNRVFSEVATTVHPEDFHHPGHGDIFEACKALQSATPPKPIDLVTLSAELKAKGTLSASGGPVYLADLMNSVPTTANTLAYAKIVQEKSIKRRLMQACRDLNDLAVEPATEIGTLLDEAQRRVFAISERHQEGDLKSFDKVLEPTLAMIEKLRETGGGVTGLPTGFIDLDNMLTGLHAGELIILAARPGCGKTSLALNIATNASVRSRVGVAVFSLEMPQDQLAMRLLSSETRVDMKRIREGRLNQDAMAKIGHSAAQLWNAPLYIDDSGSLSSFDLRTKLRRLATKLGTLDPPQKLGLVVIDYLQLMHQRGKVESRQQEVQEISRSLKSLAKELSVPIIALSQLNRKVEERKGGDAKPMLSDLRESGAIEQDADVVLFIHKERSEEGEGGAPQGPGPRTEQVEVVIAKQRNGPTGGVPLLLSSEFTRFDNLARDAYAGAA